MNAIVALLALGNSWRGDDALGLLLADAARQRAPRTVELRATQLLGPEDMLIMAGAAVALFVDASLRGNAAFAFRRMTPAVHDDGLRHGPRPAQALAWAGLVLDEVPPAFLLAVRGVAFDLEAALSPQAAGHLEEALTLVDMLLTKPRAEHWMTLCTANP
jgi:hydrogenase maturation protease